MSIIIGSEVSLNQMKSLDNFVKESTKDFDESHNHEHAEIVYLHTMDIAKSLGKPYAEDILTYASKLHDVRDHKYPNSISQEKLQTFVYQELGQIKGNKILNIIENVSYSKEVAGKCPNLGELEEYLTIIRDADRLEALGDIGLKRAIQITEIRGGKIPEDVIKHAYEKLLRLYPEYYIKTSRGRELALPRHQIIVNYVNSNK